MFPTGQLNKEMLAFRWKGEQREILFSIKGTGTWIQGLLFLKVKNVVKRVMTVQLVNICRYN